MKVKDLKGFPKKVKSIPGIDCICGAMGECECGCGADWKDYSLWNKALDVVGEIEIPENTE